MVPRITGITKQMTQKTNQRLKLEAFWAKHNAKTQHSQANKGSVIQALFQSVIAFQKTLCTVLH